MSPGLKTSPCPQFRQKNTGAADLAASFLLKKSMPSCGTSSFGAVHSGGLEFSERYLSTDHFFVGLLLNNVWFREFYLGIPYKGKKGVIGF